MRLPSRWRTYKQDVVRYLRTMSEKDALTNTAEHDLTSTLRRLADRLPICRQELEKAEVKGDT